jgi:hypothetical protein
MNNPEYGFYYFKQPRSPLGVLGRVWDALATRLFWGRAPFRGPMPEIMPGLTPPEVAEKTSKGVL